ncbi:MAG: hydantoinase/oxoprolinase family protein [Candidatus Geothermincolia bacterium]
MSVVDLAAVDVGGTFTDLLAVLDGSLVALKVPSTTGSPERGVIDALELSGAKGVPLIHGSTVATNAVLERKGARTAFIATEGFGDILEIGRQERAHLYRLHVDKHESLVSRGMCLEAPERVLPGGRVLKKMTRSDARRVAQLCVARKADSAAVCLLFSFENPDHELLLAEELEKLGIHASISSFVLPEYREYERASTTAINAYVSPVMEGYLSRLEEALGESSRVRLMHSAGGTTSAAMARRRAADLVLSGPAGGVVAARWLAGSLGLGDVISFDMGGTSTDVSLVSGASLEVTRGTRIGGLPVALPMIDINTIGAGGGSIAFVDRAGVLKVGPESAGADPGPACYGKGESPTVTDANVVLGRLEPSWFLGGRMALYPDRSMKAFAKLGGGAGAVATASATLDITLSHMETAVKEVSVERGHDPRESTLVAFGGAGPMHACELASRLEIPRVIVPVYPGLFSSMGMLLAEAGRDYTRTVLVKLEPGCARILDAAFEGMRRLALEEMSDEGFPPSRLRFTRSLGMRYKGQSHEIEVPVARLTERSMLRHFEEAYRAAYGYLGDEADIEVVNARLSCRAPQENVPVSPPPRGSRAAKPLSRRVMYFGKKKVTGGVFSRWDVPAGRRLAGPALVVQDDTTTVIPPGWSAAVDVLGNLEVEATG